MEKPRYLEVPAQKATSAGAENKRILRPMKSIELFAGAGGLGMGLHQAGFHPVNVIEWDRYCCDTLRENKTRGMGDDREVDRRQNEAGLSRRARADNRRGYPPTHAPAAASQSLR